MGDCTADVEGLFDNAVSSASDALGSYGFLAALREYLDLLNPENTASESLHDLILNSDDSNDVARHAAAYFSKIWPICILGVVVCLGSFVFTPLFVVARCCCAQSWTCCGQYSLFCISPKPLPRLFSKKAQFSTLIAFLVINAVILLLSIVAWAVAGAVETGISQTNCAFSAFANSSDQIFHGMRDLYDSVDQISVALNPVLIELFYFDTIGFDLSSGISSCSDLVDAVETVQDELRNAQARTERYASAANGTSVRSKDCLSTSIAVSDALCQSGSLCDSVFSVPYCKYAHGVVSCDGQTAAYPEAWQYVALVELRDDPPPDMADGIPASAVSTTTFSSEDQRLVSQSNEYLRRVCETNHATFQNVLTELRDLAEATDIGTPEVCCHVSWCDVLRSQRSLRLFWVGARCTASFSAERTASS